MKNRARSSFAALLCASAISLSLAACQPRHSSSQELGRDLQSYSEEMVKWEPAEKAIFDKIDEVDESQYVDDDFVLRNLKGTLPDIDKHLQDVSAFRPITPELGSLHEHYRKGWDELRNGVDHMIAAVAKKDYQALSKGKTEMNQARNTLLRSFTGMNGLMEENQELMKHMKKS